MSPDYVEKLSKTAEKSLMLPGVYSIEPVIFLWKSFNIFRKIIFQFVNKILAVS